MNNYLQIHEIQDTLYFDLTRFQIFFFYDNHQILESHHNLAHHNFSLPLAGILSLVKF